MISKIVPNLQAAVEGIRDGSIVLIGGFGGAGQPHELIDALIAQGARDLTIVSNNAGNGTTGIAALLQNGQVSKVICSFPRQADSFVFDGLYRAGKLELELVPQGTLAERIRAGGAGVIRVPPWARRWPMVRKSARSMGSTMFSSFRSKPRSL